MLNHDAGTEPHDLVLHGKRTTLGLGHDLGIRSRRGARQGSPDGFRRHRAVSSLASSSSRALEEFADGQPIGYTWLPETVEAQRAVIGRAESLLGRPFNLLNANCEDYINWIVTGVARSPQREQFALAALVLWFFGGLGGMLLARR